MADTFTGTCARCYRPAEITTDAPFCDDCRNSPAGTLRYRVSLLNRTNSLFPLAVTYWADRAAADRMAAAYVAGGPGVVRIHDGADLVAEWHNGEPILDRPCDACGERESVPGDDLCGPCGDDLIAEMFRHRDAMAADSAAVTDHRRRLAAEPAGMTLDEFAAAHAD